MSTEPPQPTDRLNADQFDDEGLPGIDGDYPPERSWAVDDPTLVNAGSEAQDDLRTRVAREQASALDRQDAPDEPVPLLDPDADGDPSTIGRVGRADPDAVAGAEEAAVHIIDEP